MLTAFHLAGRLRRGLPLGCGAMAQLVARLHGMQKVRGSNPLSSTAFFGHSFEWIVTISRAGFCSPPGLPLSRRPMLNLLTACGSGTSTRRVVETCHTDTVTRVVHVPYVVEQDEDGVWRASAQLRPGVAAFGDGPTREEAVADLRAGLELLIEEVGIPDELTLTLNVA